MSRLNWISVGAIAFGLIVAILTLARTGFWKTLTVLGDMGPGGFILFILCYAAVFPALGAAWSSGRSPPLDRFATFVWARIVRETANDLLPFSQIGGLIIGVRTLTNAGVSRGSAYAAAIIDLTTELGSQLLLVLIAIAIASDLVIDHGSYASLITIVWLSVGSICGLLAAMLLGRGPIFKLIEKIANWCLPSAAEVISDVKAELARFERQRFALLPSFCWNLVAWLLSVFSVWIALRMLGYGVSPLRALALEILISVVRSSSFLIPGAIGTQELGYVLLASLLKIDPHAALSLSLLKRGRDFTFGVPTLLLWQFTLIRDARKQRIFIALDT